MLTGAFGRRYVVMPEYIHPLAGKDGVVIRGGQRIGDPLLAAQAVAAVLRLAVNGVAGDTDWFPHLQGEREVPASSSRTGGDGR